MSAPTPPPTPPSVPPPPPPSSAALAKMLENWFVMIIDDEPDNLDVVRRLLVKMGAEVIGAENGRVALDRLQERPPHFIICDISMPVMDGWQFVRTVTQNRQWAHIPVIALTANAMMGDREKAIAAGFANYIAKPLDLAKFRGDIIRILAAIPSLSERFKT